MRKFWNDSSSIPSPDYLGCNTQFQNLKRFHPTDYHYVIQATLSFNGAVAGVMIGVFSLGMFVPYANAIVSILAKRYSS